MLKRKASLVAVLCSVFSLCPLLYSQANGSLSGTVADKTGSVIAGAAVTITSQATGLTRAVKTDGSGHYLAPLLPVAFYTIRVESQGFQTTEQKDIRLQVDEQREIDFTLNPAAVSSTVEVNATEVAVETTNPTLGQVITSEQVADLPLNGRNFVQLATLTPGTTSSTNPASFFTSAASSEAATRGAFSLSVGGSREQSTDWLLDGNDNNQLDEGGIGIFSSIDDIQEFKVLTYNYSAEYGERAGPTVLVTTKAGSNQFHGSAFEFFRNTDLDAKTPFVDTATKFNLNQFGGSLGGPIQKDKTFFFADYAAKMQRKGVPFTGFVPTTAMTTPYDAAGDYNFSLDPSGNPRPGLFNGTQNADGFGDLYNPYTDTPFECDGAGNPIVPGPGGIQTGGSSCNKIPGAMINPQGAAVAALYPAPTVTGNSSFNYTNQPTRKLNEGTWDVRVDHNFSSKDSIFGRFSYDQATNFVPGGSPTWSEQNAFGSNQEISNHGRNAAVSETHVFSPTTINQFNAGFNRIFNHILSFGEFGGQPCKAAALGIPGADLGSACDGVTGYPASLNQATNDCISCGLTSFQMSSYFSIGDRGYSPYQGGTNVYSVGDTIDLIRGKHDIRVGAGRWMLMRLTMLPGTNYVIRKEVVEKLGGWDEQALTEDSEMTVRLYLAGYHVQLVPTSVSWEQEPESLRVWFKQRRRWVRGFNYVLKKHAAGLFRAKPRRIAFEILSSHLLYYFFFLAVVISDVLLVLCLAGLTHINVPGPYSLVWVLAYATFVLQLVIALSCEPGEDSPANILLTIVMYFTYCQLWIPVVAAAFYDDFIIHRAIKWAKTERYQVGTA